MTESELFGFALSKMTIASLLSERISRALSGTTETRVQVTSTKDARFGDYQTNIAIVLAQEQRKNPREVAQKILQKLDVEELCETPEIAGAGFINFRLKPTWLAARLRDFLTDARLGVPLPGRPKTIVIDFSSPNVAKPMHVGHIRSTILGDAIARIAEFAGHKVVRDNHIGDWGTQFGMLLLGWKNELNSASLAADPLAEMERIYKLVSARCQEYPATLDRARQELVKLQEGDEENLRLWREMIHLSQAQFESIYHRLDVTFDVTLSESFYNSRLKEVIESLRERKIAKISEGALCVFSDGTLPPEADPFLVKDNDGWRDNPALVQKSDGAANYTTTDLATLAYRIETWAPDEIIYVTDGRQQLHFRQLFAIFRRWFPQASLELAHVWFGSILGDNGKPFKTRSGETIKLASLLDEAEERAAAILAEKNPSMPSDDARPIARTIGIGSVKYADLLPNRQSDYIFSWDKMLSLNGNTAPYLQYSYVRIRSIFRRGERDAQPVASTSDLGEVNGPLLLGAASELALAKKLFQFGEIVQQVLADYRPNLLAAYLYELASLFHTFFEACPVLKSEGQTRVTRLALCEGTARLLARGLGLLGIQVPERM